MPKDMTATNARTGVMMHPLLTRRGFIVAKGGNTIAHRKFVRDLGEVYAHLRDGWSTRMGVPGASRGNLRNLSGITVIL